MFDKVEDLKIISTFEEVSKQVETVKVEIDKEHEFLYSLEVVNVDKDKAIDDPSNAKYVLTTFKYDSAKRSPYYDYNLVLTYRQVSKDGKDIDPKLSSNYTIIYDTNTKEFDKSDFLHFDKTKLIIFTKRYLYKNMQPLEKDLLRYKTLLESVSNFEKE